MDNFSNFSGYTTTIRKFMKEQVRELEGVYRAGIDTVSHISDVKTIVIIGLILLVLILIIAAVGLGYIIRNSQVIRSHNQTLLTLETNNKKMLENQAYFKGGLEGAQKEIADIKETIRVNVKPGIYELISYLKMYEERNKAREQYSVIRDSGNSKNEIIINREMPESERRFSEIGQDIILNKLLEESERRKQLEAQIYKLTNSH